MLLPLFILGLVFASSCKNSDDKNRQPGDKPLSLVDSLLKEIDDVHIDGMKKMADLTKLQQQTKRVIDSMNTLPSKIAGATAVYKERLDSLLKELDYAEFAMDKWMPEFYANTDTLANNISERIRYLTTEKIKAAKIKDAILGGIQKADSLLKAKF